MILRFNPRRNASDSPSSLLGLGLGMRLALALGLLILLWLMVGWGLAP
jgi:hypothetical protein